MTELVFPKDLYTDVRIENVLTTAILFENGELRQNMQRPVSGAMIRIYDGERWYYASTTRLDGLQKAVDDLAAMAKPNPAILGHPVVRGLEINRGEKLSFGERSCKGIARADKQKLLESYIPVISGHKEIALWNLIYSDDYTQKHFRSSLGADVLFDRQVMTVYAVFNIMLSGRAPFGGTFFVHGTSVGEIDGGHRKLAEAIDRSIYYAGHAEQVTPGVYTCVLSPQAAGVFAHESFGHKSEADFMMGDETMLREWELGKQVGSPILNIIDAGMEPGSGYMPYDDEGVAARKNYLIRDGKLVGRLHSAATAADLKEGLTGNARAVSFLFEPIVRMTTTYIDKGTMTKDELIAGVRLGIYIDEITYGTGMSTFTIAPNTAYMIRDGKLAEPVKVSVISGNVMSTLKEIDGLSDTIECQLPGGCGKLEQSGLPVGFGGPYVRVNGINVQ